MSKYIVHIDDEDVTIKMVKPNFNIDHGENQGKRASVHLYEQAYSIGDTLKIYAGTPVTENLIFQGEIEKENIKPGEFICYASDKLLVLSDEAATNDEHRIYEDTLYSAIVTDLLSFYLSGVFDVTNVDVTTGKTAAYLDLTSKKLYEALQICAHRSRHTFWLEPPNLLYFKPIDTVSSGFSAIYGTNIKDINVIRDNFVKTKVIVVFQKGNLKTQIEVGTGTRIAIITDDTITESSDAIDLGNAILDEMQDIQIRGEIVLTESRYDLIPGTTVILHAPQYGFSSQVIRIKEVSYGPTSTRIQVGTLGAMVDQTLISFEERIKRIEDRGIDWLLSCTTSMQTAPGCDGPCEITCEAACEAICEPTCQAACQSGACEFGPCEAGICQSNCQLVEQISCVQNEQVCGTDGTCQAACELGHKCETACENQCQNYCQTGLCQVGCETACEIGCELTCEDACQAACQIACETTPCQTGCQVTCETTCQTSQCQDTCQLSCQYSCQLGCKIGCEVETLCCGTIGPY